MKLLTAMMFTAALLGCSAAGDSDSASDGGSGAGASGSGTTASGLGGSSGTDTGAGGGLSTSGGGGAAQKGCQYVDLLFVIDNSTSMGSYQEQLAQAFPQFVDAIVGNLPPGTDLHVGITTSSFETAGGGSPGELDCKSMGTTAEFLQHYETPDKLDNGQNGGQGRLFEHEGKAYFAMDTSGDASALKAWFTGAAIAVGESGSVFEMVAAGGAYVAHPSNAAKNAGFIRDEGAVLVVFFLTDEVDNSPESVAVYHDLLASSKAACGGDSCILTGGIMRPCLAMTPGNTLWGLMSSFGDMPIYADIDGPPADYSKSLGSALAQVIAVTCDEIDSPK